MTHHFMNKLKGTVIPKAYLKICGFFIAEEHFLFRILVMVLYSVTWSVAVKVCACISVPSC